MPEPVEPASQRCAATVWLTGLPSAGKTTIARQLAERLAAAGHHVQVLDADEVRPYLSPGLGFSRADRDVHVQRIGWVAALLARHGVQTIVALVSPFAEARESVRAHHAAEGIPFLEVHVSTPVDVCAWRDVKGLYARQARGELSGLTGVDAPYEPPPAPEVRIPAHELTIAEAVQTVYDTMLHSGLLEDSQHFPLSAPTATDRPLWTG